MARSARRDAAFIWTATLVLHALALLWFAWRLDRRSPGLTDLLADGRAAGPDRSAPAELGLLDLSDLAEVALIDESTLGPLLEPRSGPADQVGTDDGTHPMPAAGVDLPGVRPAGRGGGAATAGADSFTGRRDPDTLRVQFWTDPSRYLVPHQRTGDARASSPEWLARREESGYGDRVPHRRARDGAPQAIAGTAGATGAGERGPDDDRAWRDADPRFDAGRAPLVARATPGATRSGQRLMVDTGAPAAEVERVGALRDPVDSASASNARITGPLELSRPSSGGRAEEGGVARAQSGAGPLADSPHRGDGTAASTAQLAVGRGRESLRAARTDPYFRRLYERLDRTVVYPRELAAALEQGEVVVTFSLSVEDGAIRQLRVVKSSGFAAFDDELKRALAAIGPLGPVPRALRGRSDRLVVTAPYAFRSPLIR